MEYILPNPSYFWNGPKMAEVVFNSTNVQKLLKSGENFDLILMVAFMNEVHLGLAYKYDCPVIVVSTLDSNSWVNHYVGNPAPSSYVSEVLLDNSEKMNFFQRIKNAVVSTLSLYTEFINIPAEDKMLQKYLPGAPPIKQLFRKVSMVFLYSHVSVGQTKPHLPNMIEIGGFHISEPKELPKDLKEYLHSCKEGFILFSMGSNFRSAFFKAEVKKILLEAFSKLRYQILWKYEEEDLVGRPKNLKIEKWLPQNDVLSHPNIKLFITHGGLLSTTEAIYHGVPIVGIPVFGDQKANMARAEVIEIGLGLDFKKLEAKSFLETVQEVIDNPKYRENVQKRSAIMKDRPQKPIDEAVFWVDHVIRHKGADHFRTSALDFNYFELYQLDVVAFLVVVMFLVIYIPYKIVKYCFCSKKSHEDTKNQLKKKN